MKKNIQIVVVLTIVFLIMGCKSAEQKRIECVDYAKDYITAWVDSAIAGETKTYLNNYFDLINEYGKQLPYKTFNHIRGMDSDTEGFAQQITKDWRWIKEVDDASRYYEITQFELANSRIWFANDDEKLSDEEIRARMLLQKDSLITYFTSDTYIWEDEDPDIYRRDLGSNLKGNFENWFSHIKKQEYLIFVHTEYEYPILKVDNESFEGGIKCSHLQIFRIEDKKCLLDKRIFATSGNQVMSVYNKMIDELSIRTKYEVELQGHAIGIPFIKDPRIPS